MTGSVQERLQNARKQLVLTEKITLEVPGYSGLFAHYRPLDFPEKRAVGVEVDKAGVRGDVDRELYLAAGMLLASNTGVEARIDGETHELELKLGKDLVSYLGLGECETDRQAIFLIFPRKIDVMEQFFELQSREALVDQEADELLGESLGESPAAGS